MKTQGMGKVYLLDDGAVAYPVTIEKKGAWIGDSYDIAAPGTPEHAQWLPYAVKAPAGMFTPAPEQDEGAEE